MDKFAVHRFEELFCVSPGSDASLKRSPSPSSINAKREEQSSILDLRRANNVGIGLSRFSKRLNDQEILECIVVRRGKGLSLDDLLTLQPLMPTAEEATALKDAAMELTGRAEKFMSVMASEPMLGWMLDFLIFEQQFQNELEDITGKSTVMIEILDRLTQSTGIKILLRTVLELGNLTNYEYGRKTATLRRTGKALGFRLETLIKLAEVSSVDKRTTLLGLFGPPPRRTSSRDLQFAL